MISLGELRLPAILENVRTVSYFIHGIGQRLQLSDENLFELDLAVEEAAVNIVQYAYPGDRAGDMLVCAQTGDDVVQVTLTDWGIPLDPADVKPFDIHAPVATRINGGMGLRLIHSLMDDVVRKTNPQSGGPNTLTLRKHVERIESGEHRPSTLRELNAIRTIIEFMASNKDLDELLELVINELVETIGADRGTLYLIDKAQGELFSHVLQKDTGALREIRLEIGQGVAGHVAATGQVMNIQDAYGDSRFMRSFDQVTGYRCHTILAAPMRNPQQEIIGVVQLLNKKGGPFTSRDERLLTAMAAQAAILIENARLYAQEIQQRLINQELETARAIQKSFLPQEIPQYAGWDIAAFWRPVREVAGDFYDLYPLPDGRLAVVVADVSGKGVPGALFMALSVTVLRFAMGLNFTPGELLDRANQAIISDQQSKMFATAFVGYLDLQSGSLDFASAGHNPPLLCRPARCRCEYLTASGVAMGLFGGAEYAGETVTLADGDILVLYTDGITEVINAHEEEFGEERLQALIVQNGSRPAMELAELITEAVAAFAQDQGAYDDETMVVIKRCASRAG
jgi:serine phosphatase RsbU (regulator of sigma subunit)/anti-sigma regulatory factor (Ser/Thr protein kinase)